MSYRRLSGEADYRAAIDEVLAHAKSALRVFDRDLVRMQFDARDRAERLESLLLSGVRIELVLHGTGFLIDSPRLCRLLERHGHLCEARLVPDGLRHLADGHVLADAAHGVRRFHADQPRAALEIDEPASILPWWQRFDDLWAESARWSPPRV